MAASPNPTEKAMDTVWQIGSCQKSGRNDYFIKAILETQLRCPVRNANDDPLNEGDNCLNYAIER